VKEESERRGVNKKYRRKGETSEGSDNHKNTRKGEPDKKEYRRMRKVDTIRVCNNDIMTMKRTGWESSGNF